jgi:hypothetical protein
LKSTGLAIGSGLWETWGMKFYVPKVNDTVIVDGYTIRFIIAKVDASKKTVDLRSAPERNKPTQVLENVSYDVIYGLDESQTAARIVREATEEN